MSNEREPNVAFEEAKDLYLANLPRYLLLGRAGMYVAIHNNEIIFGDKQGDLLREVSTRWKTRDDIFIWEVNAEPLEFGRYGKPIDMPSAEVAD